MRAYLSKVLYILAESKQSLVFLLFIFSFSSLLEAFGIGLVGPFLWIASNPDTIHTTPLLSWLFITLHIQSDKWFIVLLGLLLVFVFCAKATLYFFSQDYVNRFSLEQQKKVATKLLSTYLSVPYTFYLSRDTASLIQNIVLEARNFCHSCILPLMTVFSNAITATFLLALLALTNLFFLLMIAAVVLPAFLLLYKFRKKASWWGREAADSYHEMIRVINHSMGGIKETYIIGCQPYFLEQMERQASRNASVVSKFFSFRLLPRLIIETFLILALVLLVIIYQLFLGHDSNELLSILSIFAVASIRLIPVFNTTATSVGEIQNSSYVVDMLYFDLKDVEQQFKKGSNSRHKLPLESSKQSQYERPVGQASSISSFSNIEIADLTYHYPGSTDAAINTISLKIARGESIALIGKSGAGKTTLVDVILGLLEPTGGGIYIDGASAHQDLRSWQNLIGYIPQSIFLIDDTVEQNIAFGVPGHLINPEKLQSAIHAAQLTELIEQLPEGVKTAVGERGVRLSGGQRQRIGIARALYHDREILVLDEATAALDNETEGLISEAIHSLSGSKTLIIIAHRLSTVKGCDRIYLLEKGKIVKSGNYQDVVNNPVPN